MFDNDIIDSLPDHEKIAVRQAVMALVSSGVIQRQSERIITQLAAGYAEESDEVLAERIRRVRRQTSALDGLRDLGESYLQEEKDRNNA